MRIEIDNNVIKFEKWKEKFRNEMNDQLVKIFNKSYSDLYSLTVIGVDKWNIDFVVTSSNTITDRMQKSIVDDDIVRTVLLVTECKSIAELLTRIKYRIEAKTKDELESKLMYLDMKF